MIPNLESLRNKRYTRVMASVLCMLFALILSYMVYASEYSVANDRNALSVAITEYTSQSQNPLKDANVLETKELDGTLIAFFNDNNTNIFGFARLLKGMNMKYRLVSAGYGTSSYSAFVKTYKFDINKATYYAVGGYNCDENISSYGIRLLNYKDSGTKDMLKYDIKNIHFLDILKESDLQNNSKKLQGENEELLFFSDLTLLDSEENDITENYFVSISSQWGCGVGTAELSMVYVYITIILILGVIFARYFSR